MDQQSLATTDYLGDFQYQDGKLDFIPHAEGYVKALNTGSTTEYHCVYNYTDHTSTTLSTGLGNVRLRYGIDPETEEVAILHESHYYPFGLSHNGYVSTHGTICVIEGPGGNRVSLVPVRNYLDDTYRYDFNAKEHQPELGLNWHDYHARNYDAALGRWMKVDPLESEYAGMSSYNYGFNNPVIFNDPSGMEGEEQVGFDSGVGTSENPVQLATVKIVDNLDLPWYISFGFNEYGYYRNEYSEDGFSDPYNYVRFLDNAAGSIWNLGVDIFHSFKNFSFEGLKDEVLGNYDYYTQTGISQQWEDTKASFIVMFSDIKTYENLVPLLLLKRPTTTVTAVSYEFKNITTTLTNTITTSEGFLFGGFTIKAPFNIPVQRFGNIGLNRRDFWGARIGTSQFANRTFAAIHPRFGNPLTQYTTGVIPKGTSIKFGIIGPQGWKYPGGSFQFIVPSRNVINQSTKLTPR